MATKENHPIPSTSTTSKAPLQPNPPKRANRSKDAARPGTDSKTQSLGFDGVKEEADTGAGQREQGLPEESEDLHIDE